GEDSSLRDEIEALLRAHERSGPFPASPTPDSLESPVSIPSSSLAGRLQAALKGAYRIEREIPGGGMSRLFLATEIGLDRPVVVKLLAPELASEMSAARFKREISLTAHLSHPHVLPILVAGAERNLLYYVMPFVAGESLRQRLDRESPLPLTE